MATYGPAGIAAGADDYYHRGGVEFNTTANHLRVSSLFHMGTRFDGVTIANAATITSAVIDFRTTIDGSTGAAATKISAVDEDDAAAATTDGECSTDDGIRTTAQVDWDFTRIDANDSALQTADFTSVVQELVDRAGWASGNAMLIHIADDGSDGGYQAVASYDHATYTEPTLTIVYTADIDDSTSPATVNAVAAVGGVTITTTAGTSPATVNAVANISDPDAFTGVLPATINLVAAVGSPTLSAGSSTSPATVNAVAAIPSATAISLVTLTPATVALLAAIPSVTVTTLAGTSPATVNAVAAVPSVTAISLIIVTPATVNVVVGIPTAVAASLLEILIEYRLLAPRQVNFDLEAARTIGQRLRAERTINWDLET